VVRYKNVDDQHIWIDSELIDELVVLDPADRAQETHYTLNNPQNDDDAQANPDDPEISDTNNGIDPPWRTDPFQNIINFSDMHLVFTVSIVYRTPTATGDVVSGDFGQGIAPTDLVNDGVTTYSHFYMTSRRIVGEVSVVGFESSNPFFVAPSDEHVTLHGLPSGYTLSNVSPAQYQKSTTATGNWGGSSAVGSNPVSIFPSDETGRWEWTQGSIYNEPMWPGGPIPTAGTPPQSYGTQLSAPWKMRGSTLTSGATFGSTFIVADLWATCDVGESTSGPSTVWNPATPAPSHTETFDWTGITLIYMGKTYEPVAAVAQYPDDGKIFNNGAFQALFKVIEPTA
jgi:hypothetical protein